MTYKTQDSLINQEQLNKNKSKNENYDIINFYLQPDFIKILTQQIASQPKVDLEKVNLIKESIKNKSISLDPLILAENIIKFETELFKKIT